MNTSRFARFMDAYCDAVEKYVGPVMTAVVLVAIAAIGAIPFLLLSGA